MLRNKELVEMGLDTARRSDLNLGDILSRTAMVLGNPRVSNALAWGSLLWGVGKPLYEAWKDRREERDYRFVVTEGSVLYYYLKTYIVDTIPREEQPSLSIQALVDVENEIDDLYLKNSKFERIVEENSVVGHMEVELAGVQVLIYLANSGEVPGSADSGSAPAHGGATNRGAAWFPKDLHVICSSSTDRDRVLEFLDQELQEVSKPRPSVWVNTKWASFQVKGEAPSRALDSVILKEGQRERIVGFLRDFLNNEQNYIDTGIPFHTGLLLHGVPGTGKSSLGVSLASELGLNVFYISLSSVDDDGDLESLVGRIAPRSILLLEDIDIVKAAGDRLRGGFVGGGGDDAGVTLAGLLNVLDGILSSHGVITIMTTNHLDGLDDALIRPGRVDMIEEISPFDDYQMDKCVEKFLGIEGGLWGSEGSEVSGGVSVDGLGITGATVLGIIKKHFGKDPRGALEEIKEMVKNVVQVPSSLPG